MRTQQQLRKRWGRDPRCWILYSTILGSTLGLAIGWWYFRPWLEFEYLVATYELGAHEIKLRGYYHVNRECDHGERTVWRNEAIATDGQVAVYGPVPEPPSLTRGEHHLAMTIPLLEQIKPDGWTVTALARCPGERPETVVSLVTVVAVVRPDEDPH